MVLGSGGIGSIGTRTSGAIEVGYDQVKKGMTGWVIDKLNNMKFLMEKC